MRSCSGIPACSLSLTRPFTPRRRIHWPGAQRKGPATARACRLRRGASASHMSAVQVPLCRRPRVDDGPGGRMGRRDVQARNATQGDGAASGRATHHRGTHGVPGSRSGRRPRQGGPTTAWARRTGSGGGAAEIHVSPRRCFPSLSFSLAGASNAVHAPVRGPSPERRVEPRARAGRAERLSLIHISEPTRPY